MIKTKGILLSILAIAGMAASSMASAAKYENEAMKEFADMFTNRCKDVISKNFEKGDDSPDKICKCSSDYMVKDRTEYELARIITGAAGEDAQAELYDDFEYSIHSCILGNSKIKTEEQASEYFKTLIPKRCEALMVENNQFNPKFKLDKSTCDCVVNTYENEYQKKLLVDIIKKPTTPENKKLVDLVKRVFPKCADAHKIQKNEAEAEATMQRIKKRDEENRKRLEEFYKDTGTQNLENKDAIKDIK